MQKYLPLEQIGKGSFGVVRKVKRLSDGEMLVWKEINYDTMTTRERQQLVTQVNLLKELRHPNIVMYEDRIVDKKESKVYIIMQYCSGGDLGSFLKQSKGKLELISEEVIWKVAYQILLALEYCHSRDEREKGGKVLHRDIKPANIFINQFNSIKLGDFGLSREMGEHSQFAKTHVGTPYYMSPEQVKNQNYNQKSDIWSTGCLLYEMAALKRPFQAKNHLALAQNIGEGRYERIPYQYSENLFDLIRKMLVVDPEKRLSAQELLMNPVFKMKSKENLLKQRIRAFNERELKLKEREKDLERRIMKQKILEQNESSEEEKIPMPISMYKHKSSNESERDLQNDKQNRNYSNLSQK